LPSVTAVIPALDEEGSIGSVLDAIPRDLVQEVIVIDGGSRDGTMAAATARGARVLREHRRGYGRACALGAAAARCDIVVFLDADGAADPREIGDLLAPIAEGRADLVLGSRLAGPVPAGAMPWHQQIGNRLAALLIRLLYQQALTDLGPFRAVRRARLADIPLTDLTYGWPTEMIVRGARAGWRIAEVPVTCKPRTAGQSKISGTVSGTVLATLHILRTVARHARS
jgi:glycosyltransferase involved in cell wall biosynthesis